MAYDEDESLRRNRNHSWWKQRTNMERRGVIFLIIALLIIIGLIIAIALVAHKSKKSETGNGSVCLTEGCVKAAAVILGKMDKSVNPCDDFYEFACGRYIKETTLPDDKPQISAFTKLDDEVKNQLRDVLEEPIKPNELHTFTLAKKLYNVCMNTTAIEKENLTVLKQFFKDAGGWPILEGTGWNEADFEWKNFVLRLQKLGTSVDSFIGMGIGPDPQNSSKRIIMLDQGQLNIERDNLVEGFKDKVVYAYYQYLVDLAVFFGADRQFAEYEVKNMINFEIEKAKISLSDQQRRNVVALNNVMTIEELQKKFPSISWLEYINNIIDRPDKSITSTSETVNVVGTQYISNLFNLLNNVPKRDQANYIFFQILYSKVSYLPGYIRNRQQEYNSVATGISVRRPRWAECVGVTSTSLNIALGALYARRYFHEDARENAKEMITDVRTAFVEMVKTLDWMDETTKKIAIEKALAIKNHIAYPDEYLDDKKLEDYYADLKFNSGSYLKTMDEISAFNLNKALASLRDDINKTDWTTRISAIVINAQYPVQENSIAVSAAIMQGVLYDKERPQYMNYGAIGYSIGHEITHGFDNLGRQFDKDGNVASWWANQTNQAYSDKAKCIMDQYSAITVPELGIKLNGENTLNENIADNGGIKEAYLAYNAWVERNHPEPTLPGLNFTAKQMFWISSANCWCSKERPAIMEILITSDEHSLNRYRVLVPFGNTDYFAKDFNCPVDSKMNPKNKCKVF